MRPDHSVFCYINMPFYASSVLLMNTQSWWRVIDWLWGLRCLIAGHEAAGIYIRGIDWKSDQCLCVCVCVYWHASYLNARADGVYWSSPQEAKLMNRHLEQRDCVQSNILTYCCFCSIEDDYYVQYTHFLY